MAAYNGGNEVVAFTFNAIGESKMSWLSRGGVISASIDSDLSKKSALCSVSG